MLEVVEPGLLTTVQDLGRPGWGHLGVPSGGAADPWSLRIANRLVGNEEDAAALEITLAGPRLRALAPITVALAGGPLAGDLRPGQVAVLGAGDELRIPGPPPRGQGARAYLAVAGGIDVPKVLGSRSTCLVGAFGGLDGRALRPGDRLPIHAGAGEPVRGDAMPPPRSSHRTWPDDPIAPRRRDPDGTIVLRVLPGLAPVRGLTARPFRVTPAWDRMGLRLEPPLPSVASHLTSHGLTCGTVQLPPDGRPVVLLADHQPTGGYPVVAVVIAADLAALGQLAPGDAVRFETVGQDAARAALRDQVQAWARALAHLDLDDPWDELWRSAGA